MPILVITGGATVVVLFFFFYRTAELDVSGAIFAALACAAVLALVIAATIYAGRLF